MTNNLTKSNKQDVDIKFKKASVLIQSEILTMNNNSLSYYKLSPIQYDIFNYFLYNAKKQLLNLFKNEKEMINILNQTEKFEEIIDKLWFEINYNEMKNLIPSSTINKKSYIIDLILRLKSILIKTNIISDNENEQWIFNLIRKTKINNEIIKYKLEPELFILLFYLKPHTKYRFALYKLKNLFNLSTTSTKKLYEFLIDWKFKKEISIELETLIKIMNINPESKINQKYGTFNKYHLKKAIIEINEKTDIQVSYIKKRLNNKPIITFYIESKPNIEINDTEEDYIELKLKVKAKSKLEKLIKSGYKIINEDAWIQKDIETNKEKYLAELEIDNLLEDLNENDIIELGYGLAKIIGEEFVLIDKENYVLKNINGQFITTNATDTLKIIDKYISASE